uniref:Gst16 n=1 Tax=Arundo donax TaxID=35708 RepID=A0A0A9FGC1_ARUDO
MLIGLCYIAPDCSRILQKYRSIIEQNWNTPRRLEAEYVLVGGFDGFKLHIFFVQACKHPRHIR